jgi:hypothetical protein
MIQAIREELQCFRWRFRDRKFSGVNPGSGETTSHPTKQPQDGCQVVGYAGGHLTRDGLAIAFSGGIHCLAQSTAI